MAAVFPKMIEMEKQHGSLAGAMVRSLTRRRPKTTSSSNPRPRGTIFSFDHGMETLPARMASRLSIQYDSSDARPGQARATVLALPAYAAAETLQRDYPSVAAML
jgi:hypothetical protein